MPSSSKRIIDLTGKFIILLYAFLWLCSAVQAERWWGVLHVRNVDSSIFMEVEGNTNGALSH